MITDIKIRRITCDRCNSSFEYEVKNESQLKIHNKFVFLSSSSTDAQQCTWDLCNTCYKSFINWLALLDDTKTRPEKLDSRDKHSLYPTHAKEPDNG